MPIGIPAPRRPRRAPPAAPWPPPLFPPPPGLLDEVDEVDGAALPDDATVEALRAEAVRLVRVPPPGVTSAFAQYLQELHRYPILSAHEERTIAVRAQMGDTAAQDQLVRHNLRFVVALARRSAVHGMNIEDLVQEGNLGLMRAVRKFDPNRGVKFVSYAVHWIQQAMRAGLASQQRSVYLPISRASQLGHITRARTRLTEALQRPPSLRELADHTGIPMDMVQTLLAVGQGDLSLDGPSASSSGDAPNALAERVPGHLTSIEHWMQRDDRQRILVAALHVLRPRDAEVIRLTYGLAGGREYTLEEIGIRLGITRERVRQVRDRALQTLRRHPHVALLREYLHIDAEPSR